MHQTTVRFAPDVWATLDAEANRIGVSTAQYIREAAVARLAYGLGRRGDRGFEDALQRAGSAAAEMEWGRGHETDVLLDELAARRHDRPSSEGDEQ
jgi:hypothetical protein